MTDKIYLDIEKDNIAPYLSILLGQKFGDESYRNIHDFVMSSLIDGSKNEINHSEVIEHNIGEIGQVYITPYRLFKKPSWLIGNVELLDMEHHVFVSFFVDDYFAFYFSEKGQKDFIRELFGKSNLKTLKPISINQLNNNFVNEDKIKMIWLSGIHGKSNFKADSKVLGGDSVADTLDPLIDQSYMMSAVRTEYGPPDSKTSVGINPFKSSIWRGSCKDWKTFENIVIKILDLLSSNDDQDTKPISILSYPISDCNELKEPYDFSLVDYEFFPEEDGQRRKELLRKLHYTYHAEIVDGFDESCISLDVFFEGEKVGDITVQPVVSNYSVHFEVKSKNAERNKQKLFDAYIKIFEYPDIIKCWFESGHAIINGMVFKTGYRDVEYDNIVWADYEDYNVKKEKPGDDPKKPKLENIGIEKSLFCWVKNRWSGHWLDSKDFNTTERQIGWLFCDDGAGEKADFIHYVEYEGMHLISLIHVKAAKTDSPTRKISVGAHDIVLNQGVKNLRYCSRKTLATDLRERLESASKKECWRDGKKVDPSDFIEALEEINGISKVKNRVIIVQPHTLKKTYTNTKNSKIKRQLDVLLVSAENAIRSSGAEFYLLGFDDSRL
jgi:hypothetical protein